MRKPLTPTQLRVKRALHQNVTMTDRQAKRVASGNKLSTPSDYRIPRPDEIEAGRVRKTIEDRNLARALWLDWREVT